MEMENSALMQVMATQTSILEEIRELRRREVVQDQMSNLSSGQVIEEIAAPAPIETGAPAGEVSFNEIQMPDMTPQPMEIFDGSRYYDNLTPPPVGVYQDGQYYEGLGAPPAPGEIGNVQNPLSYQAVSNIPVVGSAAELAQVGIEDAFTFDRSRMSNEATAEYFAQRSRGVQTGAVEGTGAVLQGAGTIGGFLVGGLVGGLAVGAAAGAATSYVAGEMTEGAEAALNYQDILRRDGYKAFNALESTTEYGGIGISLDDQQELSSFLRDEAVDNFLEDDEMASILQGSLDNKLLKSVDDIKSFKDKFSGIVQTVKEISLTLDQTIDEAIEFMGEMERRGIGADRTAGIASNMKVAASFLGMDTEQYSAQVLQQTDQIVQGTTASADDVIENIGYNAYLVSGIENVSAEGDGVLKQYVKNRGGAAAVAGETENTLRNFYQGQGQSYLLSLFGDAFEQDEEGNFALNEERLSEMMSSDMSARELMDQSMDAVRQMDPSDQVRLSETIGATFVQQADSQQLLRTAEFVAEQFEESAGVEMSTQDALRNMGLAGDYNEARLFEDLITAGTDDASLQQFSALSMKEQMDSARNSERPGLGKRLRFWWKDTVENPIGDAGQWISDSVGDISQTVQMELSGIRDSGRLGGELSAELTTENIEEMYFGENSQYARLQESLGTLDESLGGNELAQNEFKRDLSSDAFEALIRNVDKGNMSAAELADLQSDLDSGVYDADSAQQVQYVINKARGEYDGWGNLKQPFAKIRADFEWNADNALSIPNVVGGWFSQNSYEEIEKGQKELGSEVEDAAKELNDLLLSGDDLGVDVDRYRELEESIKSGDYDAVKGMTSNEDVLDLAERFQDFETRREALNEGTDSYMEFFRTAQGAIEMTRGAYDVFEASGVFSAEEFDAFFGDDVKNLTKEAEKDSENLMGKSDQELLDITTSYVERGEQLFDEMMTDGQREEVAGFLVENYEGLNMQDLYMENSETVDPEKLYSAFAEISRMQQTGESAAERALGGEGEESSAIAASEDVVKAVGAHEEAMYAMIDTMVAETGRLQQAVEDVQTRNYGSYTGVSSG